MLFCMFQGIPVKCENVNLASFPWSGKNATLHSKTSKHVNTCGLHKFNFITMLMPRSNKKSIKG